MDDRQTVELNARLKLWTAVLVGVLVTLLVLLDVLDDIFLENLWSGPPPWLYGLFCTIALTLVSSSLIDKIRNGRDK